VVYEILDTKGELSYIHNPSELPMVNVIDEIREPIIRANLLLPQEYVGDVIGLCVEKRGVQISMQYLGRRCANQHAVSGSSGIDDLRNSHVGSRTRFL